MSKGGGGGGTTQTIEKSDPWSGVQRPLTRLYNFSQIGAFGDFFSGNGTRIDRKTSPWYHDLARHGWYPNDPLVDYRNNYYNTGTSQTQNALTGMKNEQNSFISPFQNVTNSFYSNMVNPYGATQPTDLVSKYDTPWSSVDDYGGYLNTALGLTSGLNPGIRDTQNWASLPGAGGYLNQAGSLVNAYGPNIGDNLSQSNWNNINTQNFLNQASGLLPDYQDLSTTINFEDANPYLETQISNMRNSAQEELDRQLLASRDQAIGTGNLGGSRAVMDEVVRSNQQADAMNEAENALRFAAWDSNLQNQTARAGIEAQNQANILGYLGNAYGQQLGFGQNLAGTQADFLRSGENIFSNYDLGLQGLGSDWAQTALGQSLNYGLGGMGTAADFATAQDASQATYDATLQGLNTDWLSNALSQSLGFTQGITGQRAGYESALNDAMLDYAGQRQSDWLNYMTDADRTQLGMFGLAPSIYGMNQQNQLAPYATDAQMADFNYGLGQDLNAYQQALRNNDIARYEYNRDFYQRQLANYAGLLQGAGALGGVTTGTTATNAASNPMLGALGGGMAGYSLGSSLPGMLSIGSAGGAPIYGSSLAAGLGGMGAWPLAIGGAILGGLFG